MFISKTDTTVKLLKYTKKITFVTQIGSNNLIYWKVNIIYYKVDHIFIVMWLFTCSRNAEHDCHSLVQLFPNTQKVQS